MAIPRPYRYLSKSAHSRKPPYICEFPGGSSDPSGNFVITVQVLRLLRFSRPWPPSLRETLADETVQGLGIDAVVSVDGGELRAR